VTEPRLDVDPDVSRASTPPAAMYRDRAWFDAIAERVMRRSWHVVGDLEGARAPGTLRPFDLLPGCVGEPLLLATDEAGETRCLSNVCTHRGNLLVGAADERAARARHIRCSYHGRRFGLDGRFLSMPGFEGVEGFPSAADDLVRVPLGRLGPLGFASVAPATPFEAWSAPARERLLPLGLARWALDAAASRDYEVAANWALYVDNYLEGFHIPYVHPALAKALEVSAYETHPLATGVLQVGIAPPGEPTLALPPGHPDAGRRVAAYYLWLFPATMLNVYPWGLSVNVVQPLSPDRTRVRFLSYVGDASLRGAGAGGDLHGVEMEDEAIVERVQRGVRSRLYDRGRYSPAHETGVHRFHRLLAEALAPAP
jgi:choline monooxygenase